ncbi:hypothetical protein [Bacillus altitudinis]|uniref:hypothetical protein n=1 Tax=Bacillus altitudinis TaxID=293387 RepID=UPI001F600BB6|nr:hypothetical protein [Bacillus altitudinis]
MKSWDSILNNMNNFIIYTSKFPQVYQEAFLLGYIKAISDNSSITEEQGHLLLDLKDKAAK